MKLMKINEDNQQLLDDQLELNVDKQIKIYLKTLNECLANNRLGGHRYFNYKKKRYC